MGIQAHVRQRDFKESGGVVELKRDVRWHCDDETGESWYESYLDPVFIFPNGLRATSYHPIDLVFDCKNANQQFVAELVNMDCPFIRS